MKTYNIHFDGYWLQRNRTGVPDSSGVYMVYSGSYNMETKTVDLHEIIYIGQSRNMRERIVNHDRIEDFNSTLREGETLCYSCALVDENDLDIIENALIIAQNPRLNQNVSKSLDFSEKRFRVSGRCALLKYKDFSIASKQD